MSREELILKGRVWVVTDYQDDKENGIEVFEGHKTACLRHVKLRGWQRLLKRGHVRLGKVIWENGALS